MKKILFEYRDFNDQYAIESAWASKVGENYCLENILFYASNYSFGDLLKVEHREGELYVVGLVEASGHSTIRIIFFDKDVISATMNELITIGCDYEGSDVPILMSVDIPPGVNYSVVKEYLEKGEQDHKWSYEEACLAH